MNYADIKFPDVANGPGIRVSLFVSGCSHHCKGCFNKEAWDYSYGNHFDNNAKDKILDYLSKDYVNGITILGGEPLDPRNQEEVCELLNTIHHKYPNKSIWIYSGYTYEQLTSEYMYNRFILRILQYADILVDGLFIEGLKDERLQFRGSSNQHIIDLNSI